MADAICCLRVGFLGSSGVRRDSMSLYLGCIADDFTGATRRALREQMAMHGRSLYDRELSGGNSGNINA